LIENVVICYELLVYFI